jgi:hypothetical protein
MAVLLGWTAMTAWSQPDWSVVPTDYEFTMTVTGIAKMDCLESLDTNDIVAAFIGDEVRGVQRLRDFYDGHLFAFMIVYDNAFSGHDVQFKIYDASNEVIIDALDQLTFQENQNEGSTEDPFIFNTTPGIDDVDLSSEFISPVLKAHDLATNLSAFNESGEITNSTFSWIDDNLGSDNSWFTIQNNALYIQVDASVIDHDTLRLHLLATPESGCSFDFPFQMVIGETTVSAKDVADLNSSAFQVYPNPTTGIIQWDKAKPFELVTLYDLQGRLAAEVHLDEGSTIDLHPLNAGVYLLRLHGNEGSQSVLVVKE